MNAELFERYMKLREDEKKPGLIDKAKGFVKDNVGKVVAGATAAVAGGALLYSALQGKKVTPEELQKENVELQQAADQNLQIDVNNLATKAKQHPESKYALSIANSLQGILDDDLETKKAPGIKKEGGGILNTVTSALGMG
jgi:uncharacterized protein YjbJ (UPF0337 family)